MRRLGNDETRSGYVLEIGQDIPVQIELNLYKNGEKQNMVGATFIPNIKGSYRSINRFVNSLIGSEEPYMITNEAMKELFS